MRILQRNETKRNETKRTGIAILAAFALSPAAAYSQQKQPMNVLFLAVDDLRPMISSFDPPAFDYMSTPNLDAFAADALVVRSAHVQQAICGASRASVLTGRRPDTTHSKDSIR